MNNILSKDEIILIKESGKILSAAVAQVKYAIKPGISTWDIDQIAEKFILSKNARPSFKNYLVEGIGEFPCATCISINNEVVHGIPSKSRIVREGDLVSIDLGVEFKGLYTDMAITVGVGQISAREQQLLDITKFSLEEAIKQARAGNSIGDIGNTVQTIAESENFGVVRALVGHGIGRQAHLPPQIPNYGKKHSGIKIEEGMALAIEPMITLGNFNVRVAPDGWTILTKDNSMAAHFEHTLIIENGQPVVVTQF